MGAKKLCVLGSTGSIGTQTLDVAQRLGITVTALAAHSNAALLEQQARRFSPKCVCCVDEKKAAELKLSLADTSVKVISGAKGLAEVVADESELVLNAIVGIAGLAPTLETVKIGKTLALANKESLVAGGKLVTQTAQKSGARILPVDSEHSAIFQCLAAKGSDGAFDKLILTASGGPFFGKDREFLSRVTPRDALKHPNWTMGQKVTIDSATLMNKGLEVIEAMWLFSAGIDDIEVVVHPQSIVHSMVRFADASVIAQLALPDMRLPIQYALTYPERAKGCVAQLDFTKALTLGFFPPDEQTFPALSYARLAVKKGGLALAALNAANEAAVALFLSGRVCFTDIAEIALNAVNNAPQGESYTLDDVLSLDLEIKTKLFQKYRYTE